MNIPVISVAELNRYVKDMFDSAPIMQSVLVSGEISNFSSYYRSGHMYFSLKDENASIKAVMFARSAATLNFLPENGMKVLCIGRVGVFERDGVYQLYVERMQPDGAGSLAVQFERLKQRLEKEGLFSKEHKRPLPRFPARIGVITSASGAAAQDIFNITKRRFPLCDIVFAPALVQGANAPGELIAALKLLNDKNNCDVIIIGRGGGSAEDLWCFNDEALARAVYASKIPVISAVGHETDFTICDFVADMRAPTPSAAAELATPDIADLMQRTDILTDRLFSLYGGIVLSEKQRLNMLLARRSFTNPGTFFANEKNRLNTAKIKLNSSINMYIHQQKSTLEKNISALSSLNPLSVMLRGYAVVSSQDSIINGISGVKTGDELNVNMSDGELKCVVSDIKRRKDDGRA